MVTSPFSSGSGIASDIYIAAVAHATAAMVKGKEDVSFLGQYGCHAIRRAFLCASRSSDENNRRKFRFRVQVGLAIEVAGHLCPVTPGRDWSPIDNVGKIRIFASDGFGASSAFGRSLMW